RGLRRYWSWWTIWRISRSTSFSFIRNIRLPTATMNRSGGIVARLPAKKFSSSIRIAGDWASNWCQTKIRLGICAIGWSIRRCGSSRKPASRGRTRDARFCVILRPWLRPIRARCRFCVNCMTSCCRTLPARVSMWAATRPGTWTEQWNLRAQRPGPCLSRFSEADPSGDEDARPADDVLGRHHRPLPEAGPGIAQGHGCVKLGLRRKPSLRARSRNLRAFQGPVLYLSRHLDVDDVDRPARQRLRKFEAGGRGRAEAWSARLFEHGLGGRRASTATGGQLPAVLGGGGAQLVRTHG